MKLLRRIWRGVYSRLDEFVFLPFLGLVPRLVFGNNAGPVNNVISPLRLKRYQVAAKGKVTWSRESPFRKQGMVGLGYPHSPELTQKIKEKILASMVDPAATLEQGHPPFQKAHVLIQKPTERIPELRRLLTPEVVRIVEGYYGSHFRVATVRCWRNHHVPGIDTQANVFSNQWHNDQFDTNVVKYFVYFTDGITAQNGAFRAHGVPATRRIMRSFGFFRRSHIFGTARKLVEDTSTQQVMEGNVGFSFIANPTVCLHRAGIPALGRYRDIVQFTFLPADRPLSDRWDLELPEESMHYL